MKRALSVSLSFAGLLLAGAAALAQTVSPSPVLVIGSTNLVGGATNGLLYNNGGLIGNLATGNNGVLVTDGSGAASISSTLPTAVANSIPLRNYGAGCTLSNDGTSPNTVIDIAACVTADDTSFLLMNQSSAFTKTTGAWAVGTGNGGLDTGAVAQNTWYYLYQIERPDTGIVDYLITATYASPTMPANYTRKRYIGAIKTAAASTNILAFTQVGNEISWTTPPLDVNGTTLGTASSTTLTLGGVPNGYKTQSHLRITTFRAAGTSNAVYTPASETDAAASGSHVNCNESITNTGIACEIRIIASTTQTILGRASNASTTATIETVGWIDPQIAWQH